MKRIFLILSTMVVLGYSCMTIHYYDVEKAAAYLTANAESHSKKSCARYVRLAIAAGGCPTFLHPASADKYDVFLPKLGFKEIIQSPYVPQLGDIIVIKATGTHVDGHIAMFNGKQWISDFKQRDMFGGKTYRQKGIEYHLYRKLPGWGYRHLF